MERFGDTIVERDGGTIVERGGETIGNGMVRL